MTIPSDVRTWAEIDLEAIRHNLGVVRQKVGPQPGIMAVVKANAYGHGLREVAAAVREEAALFGVANREEARVLEPFGRDVVLLSPALPAERREILDRGFIATVSSAAEAAEFAGGRVHLKIDTGMGRIGCWQEDAVEVVREIAGLADVRLHSISTHLPVPDEDVAFTRGQLERFAQLAEIFRRVVPGVKLHALNSAGILRFGDWAQDLVRPGLMLYGSASPGEYQPLLRPALTWKTRVLIVRELGPARSVSYGRTFVTERPLRAAVLAVGYADGFPRQASGQGAAVLIGGRRCPVLGRVTMDQIVVDVTDVPGLGVGDEAVLVGRQGDEEILAADLAARSGTIAWDLFTGLGTRVKRFFSRNGIAFAGRVE